MHAAPFLHQDSLGAVPWERIASESGVTNIPRFTTCMHNHEADRVIARDPSDGARLAIRGTPTVLIRDHRFTGMPSAAKLIELVDSALKSSGGR